jgi:glycosyltransferase involved in cell wall biosynthesis
MRIVNLMLSNRFGGIGQAYIDYNACLLREGHEVLAICHRHGGWLELTERQQTDHKLSILSVTQKGGVKGLPSAWRIRRACRRFAPDVIVIHNYLGFNLLATRGIAPRVAVTHMYKCRHFDRVEGVIALTDELRTMCRQAGVETPVHIVPNMIDGPFTTPPTGWRDDRRPVIGGLGRLDTHKGFEVLIDACRQLRERSIAFHCLVGGSGFLEKELRSQVRELELDDQVEFVGFVDDKAAFFDRLDLFVAPSVSETFGITLLEAMKYGTPVVATDTGGHGDILSNGHNGILVPTSDATALANAIARQLADPAGACRLATSASQTLRDRYTMDAVGPQLNVALEDIAHRP